MPKFKVKTPILMGGKNYKAGSEIELDKEQAYELAGALENPPKPEKAHDPKVEAALKSQSDRPDIAVADWKADAETRAARIAARQQKPTAIDGTPGEAPKKLEQGGPSRKDKAGEAGDKADTKK